MTRMAKIDAEGEGEGDEWEGEVGMEEVDDVKATTSLVGGPKREPGRGKRSGLEFLSFCNF